MFRQAFALGLMLAPVPAAAGVGAEIAYSLRNSQEIYLINPDGTGKRLVYRGPSKTSIFGITMKKGGGELSFEEAASRGRSARIKTITYGESGLGTVIRDIAAERMNASTRDDGALLVAHFFTGAVEFYPAGSSVRQTVAIPRAVSKVEWLPDGTFIYASEGKVWHASLASPAGTEVAVQDCVGELRSAHASNRALISVGSFCGGTIHRLDVASKVLSASLGTGESAAYSSDDKCFISIVAAARRGSYLRIREIGGTGIADVGKMANYASVDWRGDAAPSACPVAAAAASSADAFRFRSN